MIKLNCVVCGKEVDAINKSKKRCCSSDCRKKLLAKTKPRNCPVCGKKIKPDAPRVYPAGPSIDHIIPLSRGGEHNWSNVQIAHIGCNIKKGNKPSVSRRRFDTEAGYANA